MTLKNVFINIDLFLRSLCFLLYSTITIVIFSLFLILFSFLPLTYRYRLICFFLRTHLWVLKMVCRISYEIKGLENIPKNRVGVVMSKHQSTWETFFLPIIFYEPAIIVKRELLWVPFFGWGLATAKPIAIDRQNKKSAMQQLIEKGKKNLAEGRWILIFPEGTRIPYGEMGHYKLGGARLACAAESFILPVAHNAGRYWPRRQFIKRPGKITVVFGPVIETRGLEPEDVLERTKNWIETTVKQLAQSDHNK